MASNLNKGWDIRISSGICPYHITGGMRDASASATMYLACSLSGRKETECNILTCPKRLE